ncbi:hypothetical protein [Thalassobius sp. Cn5-15]|jgi:hypothetical protein|uniref:hypothetical protein n=1 Tax=Thalassobius sp. Cn5-15 TaxID=2917763 RepID=UPI001EF183CE|nr:hypothetical protein [Thalassobius sp. Cn5-15]MCG7492720.1 hypothetical protein [Thalassobius sp. Cn5-15]
MNANQLINMVIRQVMRRLVNKGVDAGLNKMTGSNKDARTVRKASRMANRLNR